MPSDLNYTALMPEIILCIFGILIVILEPYVKTENKRHLGLLGVLGTLLAAYFALSLWNVTGSAFNQMIFIDNFSTFFRLLFLFIVGVTLLISINFNRREGINHGEYYALVLFAGVGMSLMAAGIDLIVVFLGLEVLSIATYVLAGFKRMDVRSNESSLKYFLLGSFSTAFFLYGIAFIYGSTGSTNLHQISQVITSDQLSSLIGLGLLVVGFGFKVAVAPFHIWTPDVYEGAPTPVTAFMAVGPKAAGFAALLRALYVALPSFQGYWVSLFWFLAILTMTIGNLVALVQPNMKRMLAYSSIAHAGYILIGFVTRSDLGKSAILFYLLGYTVMSIGAFAVVLALSGKGDSKVNIDDYTGLGFKYPFLSFSLALFLLSLAGIPLTAGFMAKFYLFTAAIKAGYVGLVVIAVLNSAVSVFYYVRPIVALFMKSPLLSEEVPFKISAPIAITLTIAVIGTLWLGIFPTSFLQFTNDAISMSEKSEP